MTNWLPLPAGIIKKKIENKKYTKIKLYYDNIIHHLIIHNIIIFQNIKTTVPKYYLI